MRTIGIALGTLAALGLAALVAVVVADNREKDDLLVNWTADFAAEKSDLGATGRSPYLILEPGYTLVLESASEKLTILVLDETKQVDGVETRVVEERGLKDGKIDEVSRNYFAISKRTNSVFYFGEDVDNYKNGKIKDHEGSWLAGVEGAKFGLMIPGTPLVKGRYYQEVAPDVAMDRAEIVSISETVETPAGTFKNCLKTEESTPLEKGKKSFKYYAPGVGLVQDGELKLVKYGAAKKP
jgi:hypothetical protein